MGHWRGVLVKTPSGPGAILPRGHTSQWLRSLRVPSRLSVFLSAVLVTGGTALFIDGSSIRVLSFTADEAAVTAILAASVVLGELLPITVRRGESSEPYTFSGTAAIALIITGPLWIAAVAQMSAGLFDDIRSRRPLVKLSFNVSQYAISITAARVVYAVLSKQPVTSFTPVFRPGDLIPALLAALTYFAVNIWLVAIVSAARRVPTSVQLPMALYPGRSNHGPYVARRWSDRAYSSQLFPSHLAALRTARARREWSARGGETRAAGDA